MNLPVRVPANTEAAAMGGAIQALWCLNNNSAENKGKKVSIKDLADEHVALEGSAKDETATVKPDKKAVADYNKAYTHYSRYLRALSPLYK
jgi:xylulokinase